MGITIDGAGTITGLDADGISAQPVFAGQVLQVVNATNSTQVSTTSSSYTATGLTASITPTSASSKILIVSANQFFITGNAGQCKLRLYRNGASIQSFEWTAYAGTSTHMAYPTCIYLDAPATTSSVNYEIYFNAMADINVIYNFTDENGAPVSTITLMEIAG